MDALFFFLNKILLFPFFQDLSTIPRGVDSSILFVSTTKVIFFAIIIVLFLRRGVHIDEKYLYSLLFFIQERQVREKCETAWGSQIGSFSKSQPITFVQITCTLFFLSMIAQLMSAFRGISSSELGSTQPIPSFLKIIYMQHFHLYVIC